MLSEANQEEAIEAASASMGDQKSADSVRGSRIAWAGGVCEGVGCSWARGPSGSRALEGKEGPWEVSGVGWRHSAPPSASPAAPVQRSIGAFPCRLPLWSR
jgi:hypothetical protein